MNRLTKVVGLVAGVLAVVWAMRDRFISVAVSREPEPPTFRGTESGAPPVEAIEGIGPVFAGRLRSAGIDDVSDLAGASPDKVAEAAGVSTTRAKAWMEQARSIV